jgi:hypothetical protein
MITFQKYLVYSIATLLMGLAIVFVPSVAESMAPTYIILIGSFLAIDLATMLKKTSTLPDGEFHPINKDRYIVSSICTLLLFVLCLYIQAKNEVVLSGTLSVLGITLMSILSMYLGGLEGNKLLTGISKEEKEVSKDDK